MLIPYFPTIGMVKPVKPPIVLFDMDMFWPSSAVVDQDGTLLVAFEVQGGREDRALSVSRSELGVKCRGSGVKTL